MQNVLDVQRERHIVVEIMVINLETLNTEVVLPGENILSTHAQSVRINYESHSVSKIYIFLHVAEENN